MSTTAAHERGSDREMLDIRPLAGALGAELWAAGGGPLDVTTLDAAGAAAIREALCAHHVVVIREQQMDAADVACFGRRFGELERHPYLGGRSLPGSRHVGDHAHPIPVGWGR